MKTYYINFNTGAGNFEVEGNLADAMAAADAGATYTQRPISIEDKRGKVIAWRLWYGVTTGIEDQENAIQFGDFGYYADWKEL